MVLKLLKEPLLHFLVIGLGLFILNGFINGGGNNNPHVITVDRPALMTYMQYRSKAFDQEGVSKALDAMGEDARARLSPGYEHLDGGL